MPKQKPGQSVQDVRTPREFLAAARAKLGIVDFVVDLAATRENTVAPKFYGVRANSLVQPWMFDGWGYCNPPFGDLAPWVKKAADEKTLGACIAMLVPAAVGANWWRDYVHQRAHVLLLNGRLTFIGHTQPYPKDCALLIYARAFEPGYQVWPWTQPAAPVSVVPAMARVRDLAPDGPPFLGLMLDEPTMRVLAGGVVNARAQVAATRALEDLDGLTVRDRSKRSA